MRALLMKDFYVVTKNLKILLILILGLSLMQNPSISIVGILFGATLPMTALAYDERSYFNKLSKLFPYSVLSITLSKYVLGYISLSISVFICLVSQSIFTKSFSFDFLAFGTLGGLCIMALCLPFMFKFGSEKGRLALIGIVVTISILSNIFDTMTATIFSSTIQEFLLMFVFVLLLNLVSILLSVNINQKKA